MAVVDDMADDTEAYVRDDDGVLAVDMQGGILRVLSNLGKGLGRFYPVA